MKKSTIILSVITINLLFAFQVKSATFRTDSLYSKWIIDSRMGDFRNKDVTVRFKTPSTTRNVTWDYVPGLVAKAIIKAYEQYKTDPRCAYYFTGIQDYADNISMTLGQSNIDDLNAGKMYFELYRIATEKNQTSKATTYKTNATSLRNRLKYNHNRIGGPTVGGFSTTVTTTMGKNGFWHKAIYVDEMWLDGLYMGPALYAEWQGNFGIDSTLAKQNEAWADIALQFDTIFKHTWDPVKKLNYHAWSAKPSNDTFWANQTTGTSAEFWGRGMGWFFAALMDVLEYMPVSDARTRLVGYANQVADGLKARQDATSGCWYQLLQYNATKQGTSCSIYNYLESSASSMFTYAYLKGMRLGVLDKATYKTMSEKAYKGLISTFVVEETYPGKIKLIQSCTSAGLDNTSRKGDANYYLCGSDVAIHNNTEGKVLGPFIMASLEYEKVAVRFLTQPTDNRTQCMGGTLTLGTVAATNATSYQWYVTSSISNPNGTSVGSANGGNTATFTPPSTSAGTFYYYCIASNNTFSAISNTVQILINPATAILSQSTVTATYGQNFASPAALTVTATGTGTLTYQWYKSTDASTSTTADDVVVGTNSNAYTPLTTTLGTLYYYCKVSGGCAPTTVTSVVSGAITVERYESGDYGSVSGSWSSTATWRKWNGTGWITASAIPTASDIVRILDGTTISLSSNATVAGLTLNSGSTLNISAAKQLTVTSSMTNNGTLNLQSDANGTATIITPETISGANTASVNQYITIDVNGGRNWYISSPVSGATSNVVKSKAGSQLWSYTEANTGTPIWNTISITTEPLNLMQGYIARLASDDVITFTGLLNTGTKNITGLTRNGVVSKGFNLVGNPYPSYVNWADAIKTNVSNTIWYRSKSTGAYINQTYNVTGPGIGVNGGTELIPPMQAFWVQVTSGTGTLEFQNTMRSHQDQSIATNRLKAPSASTQKLLRLQVSNGINSDETVIYFNNNASDAFDEYDSPKMTNNVSNVPEIYTLVNNEQLAINGMNNMEDKSVIPLGFFTLSPNTFSIKATELKNFDPDTRIILKDKILNSEFDMTNGELYPFYSEITNNSSRFSIIFRSNTNNTGIENTFNNENSMLVYKNLNNQIIIQCNENKKGIITVSNVFGQSLLAIPVTGLITRIEKSFPTGIYFVTLTDNGSIITKKIIIN